MECDQYKLFVGGISRETSEEALRQHFSRYGDVLGVAVARAKVTGTPRCFGFVCFSNAFAVDRALRDTHFIMGRAVDVKKAVPRHEHHKLQQQHRQQYGNQLQQNSGMHEVSSNVVYRTKKVFVGGLSSSITEEEFRNYFERFGRITDVVVMHDSITNRPRGFGFVTYESEDSVENVMQNNFHELSNKRVEVKRAIPKEGIQTNNGGYNPSSDVGSMPKFSSFQLTALAPERLAYGMIIPYVASPTVGYHNLQGFHHYPVDMYGYGYPFIAHGANFQWNNPIMPTPGFFCPPPSDGPGYLPYLNGFSHPGMNSTGYNAVALPAPDGGIEQVSAGMTTPRLEGLKLEAGSNQAHDTVNEGGSAEQHQIGSAEKPLHIDTYR
ncbi:PREDICTED: RNA-binding protein 1 [Tarenaya hassleriana]|uniref:RNA-binding protein 1 n=1 Tax=Tarenaya hassleriana TaxID=28532 RepID=UPI00053C313F|nr:PREDICTED: RNA-binding protein 1 [Tarenaya hassleriana]